MNRKRELSIILSLILIFAIILPIQASQIAELKVNGTKVEKAELILKNGFTLAPVSTIEQIAGIAVQKDGNKLSFSHGSDFLTIDLGEEEAEMPIAPREIDGEVFLPLRFIGEKLGFQVNWEPGLVSFEQEIILEDITALDILIASEAESQKVNTYAMTGFIDQKMIMEIEDEELEADTRTEIYGLLQNEPMEVYVKQNLTSMGYAPEIAELEEMEIATYMDEEFMYMRMGAEEPWLKKPHFLPIELLKEQQQVTANPLVAVEEMIKMGVAPNFLPDEIIDGREFYVIKTALDMGKVLEEQQEMLQQVIAGLGQIMETESPEEEALFLTITNQLVEEMMANSDYTYTIYVDKETLLPSRMTFKMIVSYDLDLISLIEEFAVALGEELPAEFTEEAPEKMKMYMEQTGDLRIFDYGIEFQRPDLSNTMELDELPQDF